MQKPLKLNGKFLDLHPLPPLVRRIIAVLDALPPDELRDTIELARAAKASSSSGSWYSTVPQIPEEYRYKLKGAWMYGSKTAIAELKRRVNAQDR